MNFNKKVKGITLVELIVAVSVSGMIGFATMSFFEFQRKNRLALTFQSSLEKIEYRIRNLLSDPMTIVKSAQMATFDPNNVDLLNCLPGQKEQTDTFCSKDRPEELTAITIIDVPRADYNSFYSAVNFNAEKHRGLQYQVASGEPAIAAMMLGGIDDSGLSRTNRYSLRTGSPCNNDNSCGELWVSTEAYFWADCGTGSLVSAGSCSGPTSINIRYYIDIPESVQNQLRAIGGYSFFSLSREDFLSNISYNTIRLPVEEFPKINKERIYKCRNPLSYVSQITSGKIICKCISPYEEDQDLSSPELPFCEIKSNPCQSYERFRGINDEGKAVCLPVWCYEKTSKIANIEGATAQWLSPSLCETGGWIEEITNVGISQLEGGESCGVVSKEQGCVFLGSGFPIKDGEGEYCHDAAAENYNRYIQVDCKTKFKCCYEYPVQVKKKDEIVVTPLPVPDLPVPVELICRKMDEVGDVHTCDDSTFFSSPGEPCPSDRKKGVCPSSVPNRMRCSSRSIEGSDFEGGKSNVYDYIKIEEGRETCAKHYAHIKKLQDELEAAEE